MYDDNWGCVEPSELFSSSGKTQSLQYFVDKLKQGQSSSAYENVLNSDRLFPLASTSQTSNEVKVIKTVNKNELNRDLYNTSRVMAPKILKQKRGLVERPPSLKRVTFEVERFVVDNIENKDERASAEANIAVRLGAVPQKRKGINYKIVQSERKDMTEKKKLENNLEMDQMPVLTALNKLSKSIQKKKKTKQKGKK